MNGGDALVATLIAQGVDTAFCVPGESYMAVLEALRRERDRVRLITHRHESGAAFAAEAYAKIGRRPGVVFVTRGPGATNAAIGVHAAAQGSSPLVLFIGQVPTSQKGMEAFQEIDYARMYGPIAKAVIEPAGPADVAATAARALRLAVSGRPGPVVVPLPEDVTEGDAGNAAIPEPSPRPTSTATAEAVTRATEMIAAAKHPIVIAGEMIAFEGAHDALARFAAASGAAIATSFRRQDVFPCDADAHIGHFGIGRAPYLRAAWAECDLVIAAGSRLDAITTEGYTLIRDDQRLIHIHPDADVIGRAGGANLAIAADLAPTLAVFAEALPPPPEARLAWRRDVNRGYRAFVADAPAARGRVDLTAVVATLARRLAGRPHVIANDVGNFAGWLHRYYPYTQPASQVAVEAGAMGGGVPGAIGAQLARPEATVVALSGDGGFMMTGQELATAAMESLAITFIVCDNRAYGTILMHQHRYAGPGNYHAVSLSNPDFAVLATAYGLSAWTVTETAAFAPALDAALASAEPSLIHLKTDIRDISAYGPLDP